MLKILFIVCAIACASSDFHHDATSQFLPILLQKIAQKEFKALANKGKNPIDILLSLASLSIEYKNFLHEQTTWTPSFNASIGFNAITQLLINHYKSYEQALQSAAKIIEKQQKLIKVLTILIFYQNQKDCIDQAIKALTDAHDKKYTEQDKLDILGLENDLLQLEFDYANAMDDFKALTGQEFNKNLIELSKTLESNMLLNDIYFNSDIIAKNNAIKAKQTTTSRKILHAFMNFLPQFKYTRCSDGSSKTSVDMNWSTKTIVDIRKAIDEKNQAVSEYNKAIQESKIAYKKAMHDYHLSIKALEIAELALEIADKAYDQANKGREKISSYTHKMQKQRDLLQAKINCIQLAFDIKLEFASNMIAVK